MTMMRVTVGSSDYASLAAIRSTSSTLARLQNQLSSGKQIQRPSDNPLGTVQAMNLRSGLTRNDQYAVNSDDALAWLSAGDSAFSQMVDVVQQVRTLVVKGLNTGSSDAASNAALAQQVDGARTSLLALANTTYNGRPVFGGTTAGGAAYDSAGNYVGDCGTVERVVGEGDVVAVNTKGPDVLGSGSDDVFTLLSQVSAALRSDPSTLSGALPTLDAAISRIGAAQATHGAAYQQVQRAQTLQTATGTALKTQLSGIEDVDMADMALKVTSANTAYQAALQTTASIRQLSLLDFLR